MERQPTMGEHLCPHMATACEYEKFTKRVSHRFVSIVFKTKVSTFVLVYAKTMSHAGTFMLPYGDCPRT